MRKRPPQLADRLISIRTWPWWLQVLAVYFLVRLFDVVLFLYVGSIEGGSYWNHPNPNYFDFLNVWDVEWFGKIYAHGYPAVIPIDELGQVKQNAWAFLPAFPYSVKAFSLLTGLSWKFAAPALSTIFGAAFSLVGYRLFQTKLNSKTALWAIILVNLSAAAPVLQTGYAESLGLLLIALVLYFWLADRFALTLLALAALAFARPGLAAFALAFAAVWLIRFFRSRMGLDAFSVIDAVKLAGLSIAALALNFAWPALAAVVTGRQDAYVATELAWRSAFPFGGGGLTPLAPWFSSAEYFIGGVAGIATVIAAIIGAGLVFAIPAVRRLGLELNLWVASYFVYLFLFFFPQSSLVRILLPSFVLFGALAQRTETWTTKRKAILIAGMALLQLAWLLTCWMYVPPDFSPP